MTRPSRNLKLNKCKYVYKQGQKSGKRCNKNCRGEYCKDHNKKRLDYIQQKCNVISDKRRGDKDALLLQIRDAKDITEMPNLFNIQMKLKALEQKATILLQKVAAYKIVTKKAKIEDYNNKQGTTFSVDIAKIERFYDIWKTKDGKKGKKELTKEERTKKYERLLNKRDKLVKDMRITKEIIKEHEKKTQQFKITEEYIEDELNAIEEI